MRKWLLSPWTAIITLLLVLGIRAADPSFVESVRLRYFDTLITSKEVTDNNIYLVNIDDAAIEKHGQWPFDRRVYAQLIDDLYKRNAGLVVFNVLMPENDRQGGDNELAKVLREYPVILNNVPSSTNKNVARNPGAAILNPDYLHMIVNYPGIIANIPVLEEAAAGVGIANTMPEIDGVNRRLPLIVSSDGKLYPSVALETLRVAAGDSTFQVKLFENGVEKMRIPAFGPVSTDNLGRIWIDWSQQVSRISMNNLPDDFGGAPVIVGTTATGIANPVPTARGAVFPHEVQAIAIATMANGVNIERPDYADGVEIIAILAAGIILLFLTRWVYVGLGSVILMGLAGIFGSRVIFDSHYILFDATGFTIGILLVSLHAYGVKFVSEFLQKQQIKKQFGTYLSPALVEKLQKNPELLKLGGETRELSIMFTDVRGFTTISEHYGSDVQGLTQIMNRYMTAMTAKILENNGTLDKYIGDAQMAFWNAPLDDEKHAEHAVKTALEMLGSLDAFNQEIAKEGIPPFGMGLGINTGAVVVGNMGSVQRFDYTCLGDAVNLASRLEGQSKPYHVKMILGERTAELVKDRFVLAELDEIAVKGKTKGVKVYTVVTNSTGINREYIGIHKNFRRSYRNQDWENALSCSKVLKQAFNGELKEYYEMMEERIEELKIANLPSNWDGVYRATSK